MSIIKRQNVDTHLVVVLDNVLLLSPKMGKNFSVSNIHTKFYNHMVPTSLYDAAFVDK